MKAPEFLLLRRSEIRVGLLNSLLVAFAFSFGASAHGAEPPANLAPPADHARFFTNGASTNVLGARPTGKKDRSVITDQDRLWWAFQPLRRGDPPSKKSTKQTASPIDRFVASRLAGDGAALKPAADRRTLIRRASFDLRGLPPTPEEVDDFARDRSPDAWPKLIRRLLDDPRYGERWARHWLDVARFAESSGFEHDYDRPNAYHYRDFVIKALNADMPFDQFVRWQLAGDEFAPGDPLALMATGFLGAGVFPTQITANEVERVRYDAMDDMLATTGTAMLGLTIGCARCHDHKFDPIPTEDYYRMLSTFTTTVRSDVELDLHPEENRSAREVYEREHAPLMAAWRSYEEKEIPGKFDRWLAAGAALPMPTPWQLLAPSTLHSRSGATFRKLDDGSYLVEGKNGETDLYTMTAEVRVEALRALRLEALAHPSMVKGGPGRADNGNIGLSRIRVWASPLAGGLTNEIPIARARATFEQNSNHLAVAAALDRDPKTGWAVDPKFGTNHTAIFEFAAPVGFPGGTRLEVRLEFELNSRHNIGRPRLAVTAAESAAFDGEAVPAGVAVIVAKLRGTNSAGAGAGTEPSSAVSTGERAELLSWWRTTDPGWRAVRDRAEAHARRAPKPKLTKVLVCAEGFPALRMHTQGADFFPSTYLLQRGSTELKRGVVAPGVLQVLLRSPADGKQWRWEPPSGAKFSGRRRALANWMTDPDRGAGHLLARVIVNRLWQHHFGEGLVATPNDFGVQGARPADADLLDWLAAELMRNGWHLKAVHELIMTSAAYQQSSAELRPRRRATPRQESGDSARSGAPNVERGSVDCFFPKARRLEAESVRDSLLFVSGLLDTNMFGPGTLDEASRRRSIYFTVKRSRLIGAMQAFDAPEPLVSQGARPTTTVAPQALFLMNSPQVRQWAGAFADRLASAPDASSKTADAVERAYQIALGRLPGKAERGDGVAFVEEQLRRHRAEGHSDARRSALVDYAQVVLSLSEFIYVE